MGTDGFQLIPADVIKAWSRGEYYVGDIPSISYRHLGIALVLRGWYVYVDTNEKDRKEWAGVAKVDIRGSVLSMGGIRLFGKDRTFWVTEHSHIRDDKEIVWFYTGFHCPANDDIFTKYVNPRTKPKRNEPDNRFGMNEDDWKHLLRKLATDFDDDVARIRKACPPTVKRNSADYGMLRFNVELDPIAPKAKKSVRSCEYSHFDCRNDKASTGTSRFTKILFTDK